MRFLDLMYALTLLPTTNDSFFLLFFFATMLLALRSKNGRNTQEIDTKLANFRETTTGNRPLQGKICLNSPFSCSKTQFQALLAYSGLGPWESQFGS
jgi:hypothetical protein